MKPINISAKSASIKLSEELETVQRRCSARTVTATDIIDVLESIAKRLNVPKCKLDGTSVSVDLNAQGFPGAYKGIPESTQFSATNHSGKWHVSRVYRAQVKSPSNAIQLTLSDTTKSAILENAQRLAL